MWRSTDPLDTYALCHFTSVMGDAMLAVALADSVFFSLPVGEAKLKVAAYLALTMLPLALAGPLLVPMLDKAGPRRAISFGAAAGRAAVAIYARATVRHRCCCSRARLILLVLSKVHAITKNGLTMAYAPHEEGLMRANARLGRLAAIGAVIAAPIAFVFLKVWGSAGPIYLAAVVYAGSALLNLRLPHPARTGPAPDRRRAAWAHPGSRGARGRRRRPARRERVPALPAGVLAAGRRRAGVLVRGAGGGGHRGRRSSPTWWRRGCPRPRGRRRW